MVSPQSVPTQGAVLVGAFFGIIGGLNLINNRVRGRRQLDKIKSRPMGFGDPDSHLGYTLQL